MKKFEGPNQSSNLYGIWKSAIWGFRDPEPQKRSSFKFFGVVDSNIEGEAHNSGITLCQQLVM
jgi:hypothetical protein